MQDTRYPDRRREAAALILKTVLLAAAMVGVLLALIPASGTAAQRDPLGSLRWRAPKVPLPAGWTEIPTHRLNCPGTEQAACLYRFESWNEDALGNRSNYVRSFELFLPLWAGRDTALHELGHMADALYLDDHERDTFRDLNELRVAWDDELPGDTHEYHASPGEIFAEAYAYCGLTSRERIHTGAYWYRGKLRAFGYYGWTPSRAQARATCRMIVPAVSS